MRPLLPEPMNYKMPKDDNLFGEDTSTIGEIIKGRRSSTTRGYWYNLVKGRVESINDLVGKIITFKGQGKSACVVITSVHKITKLDRNNVEFLNQWSNSEGWKIEYLLSNTKVGEYQVKFKPN